jgi:hypothetical protein
MNKKLSLADDLLLWGAIAVVAFLAFGILGALFATFLLAIKVFVLVVAIGVGIKVVGAITGGSKRGELNR